MSEGRDGIEHHDRRLSRRAVLRNAVAGSALLVPFACRPAVRDAMSRVSAAGTTPASGSARPFGTIAGRVAGEALEVPRGRTLRFDPNADTTLELTGNLIVRGRLEMRPRRGVEHVLRFVDVDESAFVGGGLDPLETDVGLWVVDEGALDIRGTRKDAWNRSGTSPSWRRRDELVVAPVRPGEFTVEPFRLGAPVPAFDHRRAEVLNLTRNVRIEGTPSGRAHVFIRSMRPQSIRHAALRHLGPRQARGDATEGVLGRYSLHFHHCHHGSHGTVVDGVVVRDSGSHAFVPHMSHGITIRNAIAYEVFDDAYWWDFEDATHDLLIDRCIAASVHFDPEHRGFRLAGFALGKGRNLELRHSVAFAMQGGSNAAGFVWPEAPSGLWRFTDNVAHNNRNNGIFVWQNTPEPHTIERFTAYHNGGAGIVHGAYSNAYEYEGLDLGDQPEAIVLHAAGRLDPAGRPQSWVDVRATSLLVVEHHLPSVDPVLFLRCRFDSGVTLDDGGGEPGPLDFVECGLSSSDFTVVSLHPDTVVRVQDGTTAFELTAAGVRDIPPFSA
ncbi:MAG TPA: hypothetical protein VIC58_11405 [Actinomycetota bacterium]|jgi:hypothetical protein